MPQHSDRADNADDRRVRKPDPAAPPQAGSADAHPAPADAQLLGDPRLSRPVNAQRRADLLLRLQRTYGNRHVQAAVGMRPGCEVALRSRVHW